MNAAVKIVDMLKINLQQAFKNAVNDLRKVQIGKEGEPQQSIEDDWEDPQDKKGQVQPRGGQEWGVAFMNFRDDDDE